MNIRGTNPLQFAIAAICVLAAGIAMTSTVSHASDAKDHVLLDARRYEILAGRHSEFAIFQTVLQSRLDQCGLSVPAVVAPSEPASGRIGVSTREGIQRFLRCDDANAIPLDSLARQGVITTALWQAVMGHHPVPTVSNRVEALTLSFEGTDFGDGPEWNLCQDGFDRRTTPSETGKLVCYNHSDPCSYMTWGPRGATAGAGREIQFILWMVWKQDPGLLETVFGSEFPALERFFRLKGNTADHCDGPIPVKIFVCSIWLDSQRRKIWETALARLGNVPAVRSAYAKLYAFNEFDGARLGDYFALWNKLKVTPSEIDYAFFFDRATHLGEAPDATDSTIAKLSGCIKEQSAAINRNGAARRCLSQLQRHKTQPEYRLARDVAYFLDAYQENGLSSSEIRAWAQYVPLSAALNFGLSDYVPFKLVRPEPLSSLGADLPKGISTDVRPAEVASCPASVLTPLRRDR